MSSVLYEGRNGVGCSFDRILGYEMMFARIWDRGDDFSQTALWDFSSGMVVEKVGFESDWFLVFVSYCHFWFST